uniref:Uncharacterized protein n=1 Tax=Sphaerodactylus townsendi TaxID=933632 RepID=A0ACB8FT90_9SAUR
MSRGPYSCYHTVASNVFQGIQLSCFKSRALSLSLSGSGSSKNYLQQKNDTVRPLAMLPSRKAERRGRSGKAFCEKQEGERGEKHSHVKTAPKAQIERQNCTHCDVPDIATMGQGGDRRPRWMLLGSRGGTFSFPPRITWQAPPLAKVRGVRGPMVGVGKL